MNDEPPNTALTTNRVKPSSPNSFAPNGPAPVGATRATFAFIFSLLALVMSGYVMWSSMDAREGKVVSPLLTEKVATSSDIESRMKAQENALTVMNDAFKKQMDGLQQKLTELPAPKNDAPQNNNLIQELSGATATMQAKLGEWEKQNSEIKQQIKTELLAKSKDIAALALLEHITRKAQLGLVFQSDVKELEGVVAPNDTSAHAYNLLKSFDKPLASDTALLAGLRALTPDFLAREKMEKADGVFDKIGIQLQKLVVVRRKNGQVSDETPIGKLLNELQTAILNGDWPKATKIAADFETKKPEQLPPELPREFAAWQQKLRDRALTEEAVNSLQRMVMNDLQGKPQDDTPKSDK